MNKTVVTIFITSILAILIGFFFINSSPYEEKPDNSLSQAQKEELVVNHLETNISSLSPEPEVLGGTFYVTNIEFSGANSGTVEYEDGHIALIADFEYSFDEENRIEIELSDVRGY